MPTLSGAIEWINSPPLTAAGLRGKVVLVDFWTYSCINCLRMIPYVRAWAEKYKDQGLVVIGVHTPEFAFEKNIGNVRQAVADLKIPYPVAIDNDQAIWRAFHNQYWPAHYFIDIHGNIRHHQFGESGKEQSERVIQRLLAEAGKTILFVTHSLAEAVFLSDRIALMREGRIAQIGSPRELYERPVDAFVARFLGDSAILPLRKARSYVDQASVRLPERLETWNHIYREGAAKVLDPEFLRSIDPRARSQSSRTSTS